MFRIFRWSLGRTNLAKFSPLARWGGISFGIRSWSKEYLQALVLDVAAHYLPGGQSKPRLCVLRSHTPWVQLKVSFPGFGGDRLNPRYQPIVTKKQKLTRNEPIEHIQRQTDRTRSSCAQTGKTKAPETNKHRTQDKHKKTMIKDRACVNAAVNLHKTLQLSKNKRDNRTTNKQSNKEPERKCALVASQNV